MKIFFLLNPSQRDHLWDWRERAARVAHRHGHQARFGEVDRRRPQSTERLLDQAVEEECERIVLVGGDGTFHRVINVLHRVRRLSKTVLALVPGGTCNDFARSWGLRASQADRALTLACEGAPGPVDLGHMRRDDGSSVLFLNNAGFGRRIPVAAGRRSSAWETLLHFAPTRLVITWEKGRLEGTFLMGVICNAPYFSGGLYFSRTPESRDGLLDLYAVPAMATWRVAVRFLRARLGGSLSGTETIALSSSRFLIQADRDLWPQADGEPPSPRPCREVEFSLVDEKAMMVPPTTN